LRHDRSDPHVPSFEQLIWMVFGVSELFYILPCPLKVQFALDFR